MQATGLSFDDSWRVIAHLRNLQQHKAARPHNENEAAPAAVPVSEDALAKADTRDDEWLTYAGGWSGRRNKSASELTAATIRSLRLAWAYQLPTDPENSESNPLAVHGLVLVTTASDVVALSQRTGNVVWRYHREVSTAVKLCCDRPNRGLAAFDRFVYYSTLDAHLLALDVGTGRVAWEVIVADPEAGYSMTGAPLVADGKVIVGVGGGEFGARGFVDAYDPGSGKRLWRFYTVPAPGEPGSESWPADVGLRGGGATWVPGAYDPELHLLYWGVGNPAPDFAPDARPGDNHYTCSVIALDVRDGKLKWSYQFTPNDGHDWDSAQQPVLVDASWDGQPRTLLLWANRNGFFYVLDRSTGEFLRATAFVKQSWNDGFGPDGRPRIRPRSAPTPEGTIVYPSVGGATNWWPPTYSDRLGLLYVPTRSMGSIYFRDRELTNENGFTGGRGLPVPSEQPEHSVVALELRTGAVRWTAPLPNVERSWPWMGGLLGIDDKLVIGGYGTELVALDAVTGGRLWERNLGAAIASSPIVFRLDGDLRLAVIAGSVLFVFDLGEHHGGAERKISGRDRVRDSSAP